MFVKKVLIFPKVLYDIAPSFSEFLIEIFFLYYNIIKSFCKKCTMEMNKKCSYKKRQFSCILLFFCTVKTKLCAYKKPSTVFHFYDSFIVKTKQ